MHAQFLPLDDVLPKSPPWLPSITPTAFFQLEAHVPQPLEPIELCFEVEQAIEQKITFPVSSSSSSSPASSSSSSSSSSPTSSSSSSPTPIPCFTASVPFLIPVVQKPKKKFSCFFPGCEFSYKVRSNVWRHIRDHHYQERNYPCDQCYKRFTQITKLREHYRVHCPKVFSNVRIINDS